MQLDKLALNAVALAAMSGANHADAPPVAPSHDGCLSNSSGESCFRSSAITSSAMSEDIKSTRQPWWRECCLFPESDRPQFLKPLPGYVSFDLPAQGGKVPPSCDRPQIADMLMRTLPSIAGLSSLPVSFDFWRS